MKQFLALLRLQLLTRFADYKPKNLKNALKEKRGRTIGMFIAILFLVVYLGVILYIIESSAINFLMKGNMNMADMFITMVVMLATVGTLLMAFFFIMSSLFLGRDAAFLASMPIKPRTLLGAKLTQIWVSETLIDAVIILPACILFGVRGLNRGIDFSGGRNFIVQFDHPVSTPALQAQLAPLFDGANTSVITIDNDTKVRISTNYKINDASEGVDDEIMGKLYEGLKSELGNMSKDDFSTSNESVGVVSSETVGPSIASDMTRQAIWAVLFSLLAMALYILFRFRNIAFSIGALAAVAFTSFIVIGFYNLHGLLPFSMEIDQTFIAAILTVIGYQVNDTVVVFDRVREYRKLYPKQDLYATFNKALCSTLSRTLMTSITTLLVLFIMLFFGGESIRSFIFAMILGVIIGTCSSLFIASPVAYWIARRSDKKEAALAAKR